MSIDLDDILDSIEITIQKTSAFADAVKPSLKGKYICFTGSLDSLTRDEAHGYCTNLGMLTQSGVTRKTDYLVIGNLGKSITKKKADALKRLKM